MTAKKMLEQLSQNIERLDEQAALEKAKKLIIQGVDPLEIIKYSNKGMTDVGLLYEKGTYFISGLVMAGEIMEQISQLVLPLTTVMPSRNETGRVVLGTIQGDIHYIGKDIFKAFLRGHGFAVHDVGVDVSKQQFLSAVHEFKPDILGFSCLISTCLDALKETIDFLRQNLTDEDVPKAYIAGGRMMSERVRKAVGADYSTTDSMEGIRLCQKIMTG